MKRWEEAGALYEEAFRRAPDREESPEGAMNGAHAYKRVGDCHAAIER